MADAPWIWFETEGDHTMSPSLTIPIEPSGQRLVCDLHSVIYIGENHFTARMRDDHRRSQKISYTIGAAVLLSVVTDAY